MARALGSSTGKRGAPMVLGEERWLTFNMTEAAEHFRVPITDVPHHGLRLRRKVMRPRSTRRPSAAGAAPRSSSAQRAADHEAVDERVT